MAKSKYKEHSLILDETIEKGWYRVGICKGYCFGNNFRLYRVSDFSFRPIHMEFNYMGFDEKPVSREEFKQQLKIVKSGLWQAIYG